MIDILKVDSDLPTEKLKEIFAANLSSGAVTQDDVATLQSLTLAIHQEYVRKIIELLQLNPEDFNTTPDYFCEVFQACQFLTTVTESQTEPKLITTQGIMQFNFSII